MTDYDSSPFETNQDVVAGDAVIIFRDKDGNDLILNKGEHPKVGDPIVIHPTKTGEIVTHGKSKIGVGDKVILVKGKDGDIYALEAGINSYRDCQIIRHVKHDLSVQNDPPHEDSYFYHKYVFELERPIQRLPGGGWPPVNLRIDFDVDYNNEGFQCWYPHGGLWLGVAENWTIDSNEDDFWWCLGTGDPHMTIRGPAIWEGGNDGENQYCVTNWLQACPQCCPPPASIDEINYIQVYLSSQSSEYFGGFVKTHLLYLTVCEGEVRDGWCDSLRDYGVRDYL